MQLKVRLDIIVAEQVMENTSSLLHFKMKQMIYKSPTTNENMYRNHFSLINVDGLPPCGDFSCQTTVSPGSCTKAWSLRRSSRWSLQQVDF